VKNARARDELGAGGPASDFTHGPTLVVFSKGPGHARGEWPACMAVQVYGGGGDSCNSTVWQGPALQRERRAREEPAVKPGDDMPRYGVEKPSVISWHRCTPQERGGRTLRFTAREALAASALGDFRCGRHA